jgi:hypothetical protein
MATIPTQEEVLAATRKSQEAMIAAIKNWLETIRTATPKVASVYAPLTDRLSKLSPVSLPFADKLPTPQDAVANAYNMAEELLASQRMFAEELLKAMTPLMPGRGQAAAKGNGSGEPKVPAWQAWQEAVAASEPKPAKSTAARPAPRTTARKTATARTTTAKSTPAKGGASTSTPKRTNASRAPKGTDAS